MGLTHHDGVSVYGSGWYVGRKGSESPMFNANGTTFGPARFITGIVGTSGHTTSLSTGLATVGFAWAQAYNTACTSGLGTRVGWSGGAIDILNLTFSGSANASSQIAWCAWGI